MQTPQWHFHDKSRSYVFGIKLEDGCNICEKFKDLLDERTISHLVSVSFSEEFAEKALDRYLKKQPIFDIKEIKSKTFEGPLIRELSNPSKDDKIRWKKQFSYLMTKIRGIEKTVVEEIEEKKEEDIDEALSQTVTNSKGQASLFGEVIENKKKRKK